MREITHYLRDGVEDWAQKLVIFHGTHLRVQGGLPEWPKGADCKSAAECFGGSNPSSATSRSVGTSFTGVPTFSFLHASGHCLRFRVPCFAVTRQNERVIRHSLDRSWRVGACTTRLQLTQPGSNQHNALDPSPHPTKKARTKGESRNHPSRHPDQSRPREHPRLTAPSVKRRKTRQNYLAGPKWGLHERGCRRAVGPSWAWLVGS